MSIDRALVFLLQHGAASASMVGAHVWPDRTTRGHAVHGGGDYAAQMLLGRMRKRGLVRVSAGAGSSTWEARPRRAAKAGAMIDIDDPIAELDRLLKEAGVRPTFDPERSTAKPCMLCGTTDAPRDLVQIGTWTRPIGGHRVGDAISRPMCASCEERTR